MSTIKRSSSKSSRVKESLNETSYIDDFTSPKSKRPDIRTPRATTSVRGRSVSKSPKENNQDVINQKYDLLSYQKISFYSNFIPTYISGAKAFTSTSLFENVIGILWVIYGGCVFYHVLSFLNMYYVRPDSTIDLIRELDTKARYFIAFSYFLVDAVYPISFILLISFYRSGIFEMYENRLIVDCGIEKFDTCQTKILGYYHRGAQYLIVHSALLFIWLYASDYGLNASFFWAATFGIPHALHPILLSCHIAHVITLFDYRIEDFKTLILKHTYKHIEANFFWDIFQNYRRDATDLAETISHTIGPFGIALVGSIFFQAIAVFVFKGQLFSLIYMLLNVFSILFVMLKCQGITQVFSDLCEQVIHLPCVDEVGRKTVLGDIGSPIRNGFLMAFQREATYPAVVVFGLTLSMNNFYNTLIFSIGSISNVIWQQLEDAFEKNTTQSNCTQSTIP